MTLGELQYTVNLLVERGHDVNKEVRITTADSSVGVRASVGVTHIYPGIDWEQGQI
jgi:hypothetical protein